MTRCRFVEDGPDRWWTGAAASIRSEVEAEFADRLRGAGALRRLVIPLEIEREVSRRMRDLEVPSPESLF